MTREMAGCSTSVAEWGNETATLTERNILLSSDEPGGNLVMIIVILMPVSEVFVSISFCKKIVFRAVAEEVQGYRNRQDPC
jgi:hypothetical protein